MTHWQGLNTHSIVKDALSFGKYHRPDEDSSAGAGRVHYNNEDMVNTLWAMTLLLMLKEAPDTEPAIAGVISTELTSARFSK